MGRARFALGLDYGTNSVRALVVDVRDGREVGAGVATYPHGEAGIISDGRSPHLARQHPADYETSLVRAVEDALAAAGADPEFVADAIIGIGVDATASTPIPVDEQIVPLALRDDFADDVDALAWLWKDHTAHAESEEIRRLASRECPEQLAPTAGASSPEWYFPKLLRLARVAPRVLDAAAGWIELGDWIVARLVGETRPDHVLRNACAAGHKACFTDGRLPQIDFFRQLWPALGDWLDGKLFDRVRPAGDRAGGLSAEWADRLGLPAGIAVAVGAIDAHVGAIGAGVRPGVLAKILGTSSCDMLVHPIARGPLGPIPGMNGVVRESILPEHWGIEGGQAAVGDLLGWFVREFGRPAGLSHDELTERASRLRPGETGLLALDWNNGNRCLLGDPLLSGLLVGQTLRTAPHDVYRALIEATAFGGRMIVDRLVEHGIAVDELVFCGGIAEKNSLLLQLYADILERPIHLSRAAETCALGAAILGSVAAGPEAGGWGDVRTAQDHMTARKPGLFRPRRDASAVYRELFALYRSLHDAFGTSESTGRSEAIRLEYVMKELIRWRSSGGSRR